MPSMLLNIDSFKHLLAVRRAKLTISHAKRSAAKMARVTKAQLEAKIVDRDMALADITLIGLAKQYGVHTLCLPLAVTEARKILEA